MRSKKLPPLVPNYKSLKKRLDKFKSNLEDDFNKQFLDLANQYSTVQGIENYLNQILTTYVSPELSKVNEMLNWIEGLRTYPKSLKYTYEGFKLLFLLSSIGYSIYDPSVPSVVFTTITSGAYLADTIYFPVLTPEYKLQKLEALNWYRDQLTSMRVEIDNVHLPVIMGDLSVPTISGPKVKIVMDY